MIAVWALLSALQFAPSAASPGQPSPETLRVGQTQEGARATPDLPVRLRIECATASAQIGEPVVLHIVVDRPIEVALEPLELANSVVGSWMFLERVAAPRAEPAREPGRIVETTSWRAFALEGGSALPTVVVTATIDGEPRQFATADGAIEIASALAEGEDAPRPAKGFREPVTWVGGGSRLATIAAVAVGLVLAASILWIVRRRRGRARPVVLPSAAFELDRLAREPRDDSAANRDVLYAVTRIVRSAVDAHVGEVRAARTDAEWLNLVAQDSRVPDGARSASRRLLERAERVKYAGDAPTRFATDEALADARAIVDALEPERRAA
jgi:hypothetical protein